VDKTTLRVADLVTSIILMVLSVSVFFMSYRLMFTTIERGRDWFQSAGLFPGIVSLLLGICSLSLFFRARKDGATFKFFTREKVVEVIESREFKVAVTVVSLLAVYIYILMRPGRQFEVATFIYLCIFMLAFQQKNIKNIIYSLGISVLATAAITYGFSQLAMIPLP